MQNGRKKMKNEKKASNKLETRSFPMLQQNSHFSALIYDSFIFHVIAKIQSSISNNIRRLKWKKKIENLPLACSNVRF